MVDFKLWAEEVDFTIARSLGPRVSHTLTTDSAKWFLGSNIVEASLRDDGPFVDLKFERGGEALGWVLISAPAAETGARIVDALVKG